MNANERALGMDPSATNSATTANCLRLTAGPSATADREM